MCQHRGYFRPPARPRSPGPLGIASVSEHLPRHFRPRAPSSLGDRDHDPAPRRPRLDRPRRAPRPAARRGRADALQNVPWSEARRLIETGKVRVAGEVVTNPDPQGARRATSWRCSCAPRSPRRPGCSSSAGDLVVYADPTLVVVRKPAGMSTVPFGDEAPDEMTLDALVREVMAAARRHPRARAARRGAAARPGDERAPGVLAHVRRQEAPRPAAPLPHHAAPVPGDRPRRRAAAGRSART